MLRRLSPLLVILVLLLGAGLRLQNLETQSLSSDEGRSAAMAQLTVPQIIAKSNLDSHPPGYFVLLKAWSALTGRSEFALRMFSALMGVISIAAVYAIGTALFDRPSALLAALFAAVNPFQVWYAQEAHMPALLAMVAALSIWLTIKVLNLPAKMIGGRFDRREAALIAVSFVLINTLGLYTHYTFPLILLAETLIFVIWLARRVINARTGERKLSPMQTLMHGLRVWLILNLIPAILFAAWLLTALRHLSLWSRGVGEMLDPLRFASTLAYGITLPPDAAREGLIPLAILMLVALFPPTDPDDEERRHLRFAERVGLILAWLILPIAAVVLRGAITEPALKFLVPGNLAIGLLAARGLVVGFELSEPMPGTSAVNSFFIRLMMVVLAILAALPMSASLRNLYGDASYARDDYRAIAARILAESGSDAAVLLVGADQKDAFTYYYSDSPNILPLPDDSTEAALDHLLSQHRRIYVLWTEPNQHDPDGIVLNMLGQQAVEASSDDYGDVRLAVYGITGSAAREMDTQIGATFGENIILDGFTPNATTIQSGDGLGVTLFWHATQTLDTRYKVFVHLYAADGALIAQHDSEPANFTHPTDTWEAGEIVIDLHGLLIPLDVPSGDYRLAVGVYGSEDGQRLPVMLDDSAQGDTLTLTTIQITP